MALCQHFWWGTVVSPLNCTFSENPRPIAELQSYLGFFENSPVGPRSGAVSVVPLKSKVSFCRMRILDAGSSLTTGSGSMRSLIQFDLDFYYCSSGFVTFCRMRLPLLQSQNLVMGFSLPTGSASVRRPTQIICNPGTTDPVSTLCNMRPLLLTLLYYQCYLTR